MKAIATALVKAKRSFGPALKLAVNPHLKNKYADLGACLDAVDDALLKEGIFMYQETAEDASGVTVETVFLHETGETLRCGKLHVPATKSDPQGYGSALTYARRYSLVTACGIAQEDDDGNAASNGKAKPAQQRMPDPPPILPPPSQEQMDEIIHLANTRDLNKDQAKGLSEWLKLPQTMQSADKMVARLKQLPEIELV